MSFRCKWYGHDWPSQHPLATQVTCEHCDKVEQAVVKVGLGATTLTVYGVSFYEVNEAYKKALAQNHLVVLGEPNKVVFNPKFVTSIWIGEL